MFDTVFKKLQAKRSKLFVSWDDRFSDTQELFHSALQSNDWSFTKSFSSIAKKNVQVALDFRNMLESSRDFNANEESICLILHGSTAHGKGRTAPNIDHKICYGTSPQMITTVIPKCRDDVDLILIVNRPKRFEKPVRDFVHSYYQNGIDITVNLLSWTVFWKDLSNAGSPAIRRIVMYNYPVFLIGHEYYTSIIEKARSFETWLDVPHELDFRLLMKLAETLSAQNMSGYTFSTPQLLELFPTFYMAGKDNIHIGFPEKRIKIKGQTH